MNYDKCHKGIMLKNAHDKLELNNMYLNYLHEI